MWIRRRTFEKRLEEWEAIAMRETLDRQKLSAENTMLRNENAQLRATQEWMKLRLNSVEKERAQLIHAAIGVKLAIPEFVPAGDPAEAFHEMPDLSSVGGDAKETGRPREFVDLEPQGQIGESYTNLPGYQRNG
jgi:hypothetical protein